MIFDKVFLLQTDIGTPDPWDDCMDIANAGVNPGLGLSNNAVDVSNRVSFFQRVDNRFAISRSLYNDAHLVLKRPFSTHEKSNELPLNFNKIAELVDKHTWHAGGNYPAKVIMFCSIYDDSENLTQEQVMSSAAFYSRDNDRIYNVETGEEYKNPKMIPWFFCYRTDEKPLYYIVMNPYSVQCIEDIEGTYNGCRVFTISNHLKNLNHIIFKPRFSKNARVIGEHNVAVRGETFTVEPFGTWFVKAHLPEFFKGANFKVDTNFDYEIVDGKIKINTKGLSKGYLIIRWNTATGMDLIFHTSKNRFFADYIVDVF